MDDLGLLLQPTISLNCPSQKFFLFEQPYATSGALAKGSKRPLKVQEKVLNLMQQTAAQLKAFRKASTSKCFQQQQAPSMPRHGWSKY
jgi:hypothetical protein